MRTLLQALQGSVTGKVLFIGALVLLLLVPLGMIEGLIHERSTHYETARTEIARTWGGGQLIGGPILVVPFRFTRPGYSGTTETDEIYLLPATLDIAGTVDTESRQRGIYSVPVYTARLRVTGRLPPPQIDGNYENLELRWSEAEIVLPVSDTRSLRAAITLTSGAGSTVFGAGGERIAGLGPQLVAPFAALGLSAITTAQDFSFDLVIGGTGALSFLPLGSETRVTIASNWPSPSATGAHLPDDALNPTADGFTAAWRVLDFGRGYPSSWRSSDKARWTIGASAFGAEFINPVGVHEATLRATKYAVFIVGLTFVAYFLFELFATLRLHPLQYLLIGLANCVFYVLLLALAEHVGFNTAYATSAVAATALISSYSAAALRSYRRALPIAGLLGGLYGYLFVTLRAEDFALLIGAIGAFAVLATFMYLTRRVDWFDVRLGGKREPVADHEPPSLPA